MAKKIKTKGTAGNGNRACYDAMMELRRSSAAQRHTPKRYKGSRAANKAKAISAGW